MAHTYQEHREHKVKHSRVSHIARGYATGGAVHDDEAEDEKLIRKEVKESALKRARGGKIEGKSAKGRLDRGGRKRHHEVEHRATGGRVGKKKGPTTVNVIVAGHGGQPGAGAPPGGPPPAIAAPPPPPPPRPPMLPPGAGPGMPPGGMPPGGPPMIRASGGRVTKKGGNIEPHTDSALPKRAKGGRVADGPAWKEGLRNGTKVQHSSDKATEMAQDKHMKGERHNYNYRTGGKVKDVSVNEKPPFSEAVEAGMGNAKANPYPEMTAGSKSGVGRLQKLGKSRGASAAP